MFLSSLFPWFLNSLDQKTLRDIRITRETIKREADVMAKDFESLRKKLKALEPKVRKVSNIDFAKIKGDLDTTEMYLALIRGVVMMK